MPTKSLALAVAAEWEWQSGRSIRPFTMPLMALVATCGAGLSQSDKTSHIDMGDDRIDTVISHIISPYPISISRMTISIW